MAKLTLKDITKEVIIKRGMKADAEDEIIRQSIGYDPYQAFQEYKNAYLKSDTLSTYRFTGKDLLDYTDDVETIRYIMKNPSSVRYYLTEDQITSLLNKKRDTVIREYEEYNNYYRTLLGLPNIQWTKGKPIIPSKQKIYIKEDITGVDKNTPLHLMSIAECGILRTLGVLDALYEEYKFEWIKYVGLELNIINLRMARNFDIVYYNKEKHGMSEFYAMYRNVRNSYMINHYNEYDIMTYEFMEPIVCVHLLMTTLACTTAENIFSKEIDTSDLRNIFRSYGLPKFNISDTYLLKIADKLNVLIEHKGTSKGLAMLSDIFDGISIFKYFITKRLKGNGELDYTGMSSKDKYDLYYVRAPLDTDDVFDYIDDTKNRRPFKQMAEADPLWGFEDKIFEDEIKDIDDFTYSNSKYLALENKVDIVTFAIETAYFVRFVIEHTKEMRKLRFYLDTVGKQCTMLEILTYLQVLIFRKYKIRADIPDSMESVIYMYSIKNEADYEGLKRRFRDYFKWHRDSKLKGLNIDEFVEIVDGTILSFRTALDAFEVNFKVIEKLKKYRLMTRDRRDYHAIETLIQAITYGQKLPELYNNKTNFEDFLVTATKTSNLFQLRLLELDKNATDEERKDRYNNEINEIIALIRQFCDRIKHKKLLGTLDKMQSVFTDIDLLSFLETVIDFFKSYTQDVINKGVVYLISDIGDNLKITERFTRFINMNLWETVLLSLYTGKYNKELVTYLNNKINYRRDTIFCNETVQRIDDLSCDNIQIGYTINKLI